MRGQTALVGTIARPGSAPSRTYRRGRVCTAERCSTVLSMYNAARFCWRHDPVILPRTFGHRGKALG